MSANRIARGIVAVAAVALFSGQSMAAEPREPEEPREADLEGHLAAMPIAPKLHPAWDAKKVEIAVVGCRAMGSCLDVEDWIVSRMQNVPGSGEALALLARLYARSGDAEIKRLSAAMAVDAGEICADEDLAKLAMLEALEANGQMLPALQIAHAALANDRDGRLWRVRLELLKLSVYLSSSYTPYFQEAIDFLRSGKGDAEIIAQSASDLAMEIVSAAERVGPLMSSGPLLRDLHVWLSFLDDRIFSVDLKLALAYVSVHLGNHGRAERLYLAVLTRDPRNGLAAFNATMNAVSGDSDIRRTRFFANAFLETSNRSGDECSEVLAALASAERRRGGWRARQISQDLVQRSLAAGGVSPTEALSILVREALDKEWGGDLADALDTHMATRGATAVLKAVVSGLRKADGDDDLSEKALEDSLLIDPSGEAVRAVLGVLGLNGEGEDAPP